MLLATRVRSSRLWCKFHWNVALLADSLLSSSWNQSTSSSPSLALCSADYGITSASANTGVSVYGCGWGTETLPVWCGAPPHLRLGAKRSSAWSRVTSLALWINLLSSPPRALDRCDRILRHSVPGVSHRHPSCCTRGECSPVSAMELTNYSQKCRLIRNGCPFCLVWLSET